MKVSALIEQLQTYNSETEVIVAYWDKEQIESYGAPTMTEEQWSDVIESYENGEWFWQSSAAEDFVEIAERVVATGG